MAVGNLALNYPDPVANALGQLNESLRGASGDVLKRRQLDLAAQQLEAQAAHQAQLARLQEQTITGQSTAELAKVKGTLALQEKQETRLGQESDLKLKMGAQEMKHAAAEHPVKLRGLEADIVQSHAAARASGASAAASAQVARLNKIKADAASRPVGPEQLAQIMAGLTAIGGEGYIKAVTPFLQPENIKNVSDLEAAFLLSKSMFPEDANKLEMNAIAHQLSALDPADPATPETRRALEQDLQVRRGNAGLLSKTALSSKDAFLGQIEGLNQVFLRAGLGDPDVSDDALRVAASKVRYLISEAPTFLGAGEVVNLPPFILDQFGAIAKQQAIASNEDPNAPDFAAKVTARAVTLAEQHGSRRGYEATLRAKQASPQATPLTPAAPTAARDLPVTPGAQAVREQQRARLSSLAAAGQTQTTTAQASHEWAVLERNATSTGLATIPEALRPQAQALYLQLRQANPTAPPIEVLNAVKAQLIGAPR